MKVAIVIGILLIIVGLANLFRDQLLYYSHYFPQAQSDFVSPASLPPKEKPLEKYTFENLARRQYGEGPIRLDRITNETDTFTSYVFTYPSDGKRVSGLAHIPKSTQPDQQFPVIIMIRGFVDKDIYQTGVGTWRAGQALAQQGFITVSLDYLGYGDSDDPEDNVFWERFNRPVQVLNLIASISTLPAADPGRIGLWGHSNGGQVALSILEISGRPYPTVLWAPVSKPFPYSILYYTDEFEDHGKALRQNLARLERDYDVQLYSITEYFDWVTAPIQLHQGGKDDAVPLEWSDELANTLRANEVDLTYYIYPLAGHNLEGGWDTAMARDVTFYKQHLSN
jgi:dipeptidyl aminopeptidase/acylaminoacyl peptidase